MHPAFKKHYTKKKLPNGKPNPRYVDLLDEDPPINGQNFCVVSFASPEEIIRKKETYMFEEFVHDWDFNKSMEKFDAFMHMMSHKYAIDIKTIQDDLKDFVKEEEAQLRFTVLPDYTTFIEKNEERLEKAYSEANKFQTCVRGIKVRGVFETQEQANERIKFLRNIEKDHDMYVGEMMKWMPFHPKAYRTGNVEYMEEELNELMHEKSKNEQKAKEAFETRVREAKEQAIEENRKKAEKTGNVVTQTLDESGELIAIESFVDKLGKEHKLNTMQHDIINQVQQQQQSTIDESTIQNVLFDTKDVVVGKTDHGQSQLRSGPFASSP